jgi:muramoyltetrapeptide carboxypeptidase
VSLAGRTIRVVAPARWVEQDILDRFTAVATAKGATVQIASQCTMRDHQLAGPDDARAAALNDAITDETIDIIWCARGGYGAPRLLDKIDFTAARGQKLLVGYSDITALHQAAFGSNVKPIHAAMPFDLRHETRVENVERALHLCDEALTGVVPPRTFDLAPVRMGGAKGALIAGNLHVLAMLLGTRFEPDWPDCVLCVEDVGEYFYAIDRLFWRLSQSRLAPRIKAIALGAFTENEDNEIPWGASVQQIAAQRFPAIPIATGMPIGHGDENKPLIIGAPCSLRVDETSAALTV